MNQMRHRIRNTIRLTDIFYFFKPDVSGFFHAHFLFFLFLDSLAKFSAMSSTSGHNRGHNSDGW